MYNNSMPPPPPAPPRATLRPYGAAASTEAYGSVSYSQSQSQSHPYDSSATTATRRRAADTGTYSSTNTSSISTPAYAGYRASSQYAPTGFSGTTTATSTGTTTMPGRTTMPAQKFYKHNTVSLAFLSPVLSVLWWHPSAYPLQVFLFAALALYAVDLANDRDMTAVGIWIAFSVVTATNVWTTLVSEGDWEPQSTYFTLLRVVTETFLFLALACCCTMQLKWLHAEMPAFAIQIERILHAVLPPTSASVLTYQLTSGLFVHFWGTDSATTLAPYIFCFLLTAGMLWVGSCDTSFTETTTTTKETPPPSSSSTSMTTPTQYILPSSSARIHSMLLLLGPPLIHISAFSRRILSPNASYDEWQDLILIWSIPYLLHYGIALLHHSGTWKGPYLIKALYPQPATSTLRGAFAPMVVSLLASLALQQRHLIPICHFISYQFNGHDLPSTMVVSFYLTLSTIFGLFCAWMWGKTSAVTNEPLLGEYHEDVVQISTGLAGMFVGKAVGMPWALTPVPVLGFLGLSVWIATGMMRFLAIVLFAAHSAVALLFSYRYGGINYSMALSIPKIEMQLFRFGMTAVVTSMIIWIVAGFAVRPSGGIGHEVLKKVDVAGILLILYGILLTVLECTLLKQKIPFRDLVGINAEDAEVDENETMYNPLTSLATSVLLVAITVLIKRFKVIYPRCAVIAMSVAIGKFIAVVIDMQNITNDNNIPTDTDAPPGNAEQENAAAILLLRSVVASLLLSVMAAPSSFLKPIYIKTGSSRLKRFFGPSGKPPSDLPRNVGRTIILYFFVVLPIVLITAAPLILQPLIGIVSGRYSGAYYTSSPAASEVIGFAAALWGVSCLFMVNFYLPDGGGEAWKKISALVFLMGLGLSLAAPTLPSGIVTSADLENPFASISSLGSAVVAKGNRSGGWGLISASLATLLALTGPLELAQRKDPRSSTGKDKSHLLRMMIFSLLFGCGIAWFISLQSMSEEEFLPVFLVTTSCMAMAFFGTIAGVLGFFLDLESFGEVEEVMAVWGGAFIIFLGISGVSQFVKGIDHPFGIGGWLSTYLSVCTIVTLGFSLVLGSRSTKNSITRGKGNLSCILSWIFSITVLYGKYGVAGLDLNSDVTTVFGIPASVFGTLLASTILLALQGEYSKERSNRIQRLNATQNKTKHPFGINLEKLQHSNRFTPLVAGTACVFVFASIYAIFFRGAGFMVGDSGVATSHEDVFASVYGGNGKGETSLDDVATMAEKNLIHSQVMVTAARLAGSGFWTADNMFGPLLHFGGLLATLPGLYLLISHMWSAQPMPLAKATLALPLNLIPLVMCSGIPTLRAAAVLGGAGGLLQLLSTRQKDWETRMQI